MLLASILVASGTFEQILSYFMVGTIASLSLMVAAVCFLPAKTEPGRVPGCPLTPAGFLIPVSLVVLLATTTHPIQTGVGAGVVLLGVPVYALFLKSDRLPRRE